MAYPKSYLARFPIGHTVVTRKPLSWLLYAAETANIRSRLGLAATTDRKASASSPMQNRGREKKKSWLNNAGISAVSTSPAILQKYWSDILDTSHPIIGQVQLKAVMDKSLILEHFEKYPDIDVYATSEVASQLLDVKDSGFSNRDLHEDVAGFVAEIGIDDTIEKAGSGFVLGASMSTAISLADAIKKGKISRHAVRRAVKDGSLSAAIAAAVDFILS